MGNSPKSPTEFPLHNLPHLGVYMPSYVYLRRVHICYVIAALIPLCILGCDSNADQEHLSWIQRDISSLKDDVRALVKIEKLKVRRENGLDALNSAAEKVAFSRAWKIEVLAFQKHNEANYARHKAIVVDIREARSVGPFEGYERYNGGYQTTYTTLLPEVRAEILDISRNNEARSGDTASKYEDEIKNNLEIAEKNLGNYPDYTKDSLHELFKEKLERFEKRQGLFSVLLTELGKISRIPEDEEYKD